MEKYSTVVLAQSWTPFFSPSTVWLLHLASCLQIRTAHGSSQILSPVVDLFSEPQTHKSNCQIKPPLKRQIVIKLNMLKAVSIHSLIYYSPTFSINGNFILLVVQANIFDVIPVFCLFLHPITYHQEILLVRLKKYRNTVIILFQHFYLLQGMITSHHHYRKSSNQIPYQWSCFATVYGLFLTEQPQ